MCTGSIIFRDIGILGIMGEKKELSTTLKVLKRRILIKIIIIS